MSAERCLWQCSWPMHEKHGPYNVFKHERPNACTAIVTLTELITLIFSSSMYQTAVSHRSLHEKSTRWMYLTWLTYPCDDWHICVGYWDFVVSLHTTIIDIVILHQVHSVVGLQWLAIGVDQQPTAEKQTVERRKKKHKFSSRIHSIITPCSFLKTHMLYTCIYV